jgi:hypothetical protein
MAPYLSQDGRGSTFSVTQQETSDWCNVELVIGPYANAVIGSYVRIVIGGTGSCSAIGVIYNSVFAGYTMP